MPKKKSKSEKEKPIEVLSPKQNGSAGVDGDSNAKNKSTMKGMWKKAFRSLKSRDKVRGDKERDKDKEKDKEKDRDKDDRISEKSEDSGRYSRQTSRQSSLKRVLKRKDSKEASDSEQTEDRKSAAKGASAADGSVDPIFTTLRMAHAIAHQPSVSESDPDQFEAIDEEEEEKEPGVFPSSSQQNQSPHPID